MKKSALAATLAVISSAEHELEAKATAVLRIVRSQRIGTLKEWGAAVRAAYKANGWNGKPGKPKAGNLAKPVPGTVKQYVSAIRRAFRLKLPVSSYTSFYALRQDLRKRSEKAARKMGSAAHRRPEFAGITLARPDELTGAPFHDLAALYGALDRTRKPMMLQALDRVKRQFAMAAPQLVVAALPEMRRAA